MRIEILHEDPTGYEVAVNLDDVSTIRVSMPGSLIKMRTGEEIIVQEQFTSLIRQIREGQSTTLVEQINKEVRDGAVLLSVSGDEALRFSNETGSFLIPERK